MLITILVLAANPLSAARIVFDREIEIIRNALKSSNLRDSFRIETLLCANPETVPKAVLNAAPTLVHFIGHGSGVPDRQGLIFDDGNGDGLVVGPKALEGFFKIFRDQVRCVVLNACNTSPHAEAISHHIDFVVGMKGPISDPAAIAYVVAFYNALGVGKGIETAHALGKNALLWLDSAELDDEVVNEHEVPELYRRDGVGDLLIGTGEAAGATNGGEDKKCSKGDFDLRVDKLGASLGDPIPLRVQERRQEMSSAVGADPVVSPLPESPAQQRQFMELIVSTYRAGRERQPVYGLPAAEETAWIKFLESYIELHQSRNYRAASDLYDLYKTRLDELPDFPPHVCSLLEEGLPRKPVHLETIGELSVEKIVRSSEHSAFLLGLRLTEIDYVRADETFERILQDPEWARISQCHLFAYARAVCARKLGRLETAHGIQASPIKELEQGQITRSCECGGTCYQGELLVQMYRNQGSIFRKLSNDSNPPSKESWKKAQDYFSKAISLVEDMLSKGLSIEKKIQAEVNYSYGYFLLEGYHLRPTPEASGPRAIREAVDCFERARKLRPKWGAPPTRRAICKLISRPCHEENYENFLSARAVGKVERGGESALTYLLAGFGMLAARPEAAASHGVADGTLTPEKLYQEAIRVVERRPAAKGPFECHALDCEMIARAIELDGKKLFQGQDLRTLTLGWRPKDRAYENYCKYLILINKLLWQAPEWNIEGDLEQQIVHLQTFRADVERLL